MYAQAMMDRTQKDKLPAMQVGFIDNICMPVYEVSDVAPKSIKFKMGHCIKMVDNNHNKTWCSLLSNVWVIHTWKDLLIIVGFRGITRGGVNGQGVQKSVCLSMLM